MDRKRMEEVARNRAPKRPKVLDMQEAQEMTGGEAIRKMLGDVQTEPAREPRNQIVLYLKEGLNAAERNFTKYPNEMHTVMTEHLDKEYEGILYMYLWRKSFGYGRNYCRTSYLDIQKNTLIRSRKTAQRAIGILAEKHFVIRARLDNGTPNVNQQGALYRIMTPVEIKDQRTEEDVFFVELPSEGVVCQAIPSLAIAENIGNSRVTSAMACEGMAPEAIGQTGHTLTGHPLKEDSLKDSLSEDPVKLFYTGIGQQRISKVKREKGASALKELQKEGFSPEDIQFAIKWTLKPGNTKEKVHDFSIISHTIGQALSAREAGQQAADKVQKEASRVRAAEEEQKRLEGEIEDLRSKLNEKELADLRKRAEKEIAQTDGMKKEFINEPLIVAKENEIVRREAQERNARIVPSVGPTTDEENRTRNEH